LTAENISKYTIQDVILPLPGFNVKYPENECLEWYKEMFAKDGLTLDSLKQNVKYVLQQSFEKEMIKYLFPFCRKYSLGGAYRKISILPSKVNWKITFYDDETQPLVLSDIDVVEKKEVVYLKGILS
jgi:tRNA pseudouridine13 synthase